MALDFVSSIVSCIKYSLFAFNFVFVITGIILISVGAAVQAKYDLYSPVLDQPYTSVPALLIAIGVIIFIVAFFGCCGAIKENYCMTLTFSVLLIIIFILELAAGISGYVLRDRTEAILTGTLTDSLSKYGDDKLPQFTELWDDTQRNLQCCGVKEPKDWETKFPGEYPLSCCNIPAGTTGSYECKNTTDVKQLHGKGCVTQVVSYVKSHAGSLGAAGICFAILQFLGIICACYLAKRSKNEYIP